MTDSRAALDLDRLPWLEDEWRPRRKLGWAPVMLSALLALVLVAAVSYWVGLRSADNDELTSVPGEMTQPPAATIILPEPTQTTPAVDEAEPPVIDDAAPVPVRAEPVGPARPSAKEMRASRPAAKPETKAADDKPAESEARAKLAPATELWPADVSENAYGRVARIGTFSSRLQAKRAWWKVMRTYPGMRRLKAVVVAAPSLRNGRTYYRLQFGTTSQAHSEILCQRMRIIGQSCVVVGVAKSAKGAAK